MKIIIHNLLFRARPIGEFDMWNMKKGNPPEDWEEKKKGTIVKVPSRRLDDIIYNKVKPNDLKGLEAGSNPPDIDRVFALKVDTQGEWDKIFRLKFVLFHAKTVSGSNTNLLHASFSNMILQKKVLNHMSLMD